jgi:RNA polymerase sigma-70 factor, ECF subfamily
MNTNAGPAQAGGMNVHAGVFQPPNTDEELLDRIRGGDRSAADALAQQEYRAVYAYLRKLTGDTDRAADLTQETFRKAWQSLGRFDGRSRISTWLHRIAYTTFLNAIRGPRLVSTDDDDPPPLADPSPSADDVLRQREDERRLRSAVMALPDPLRFTITAHYWGEMPVREIAEVEKITTVAVRKRLARALEQIERQLTGASS